MLYIELINLKFYAFHGLYDEEKVLGNHYVVNLKAGWQGKEMVLKLHETIDYTAVHRIVSNCMAEPTPLLETVAGKIRQAIVQQFPLVEELFISIHKLYPPVNNFEGSVGVSFEWKKDIDR